MDPNRRLSTRTRLVATLVLVLGLAAPLAACGDDEKEATGGTTAPGPDRTGPDQTGPAADLPADQVVWVDTGGGGMMPPSPVAPNIASLTIYGDGRAFRAVAPADRGYLEAVPIEVGTVAPDDLAELVAAVEESGLFSSDETDFGEPQVTDSDGKVVRFHGSGSAVEVSAYAFREDFEQSLTEGQQERRAALRALLAQAEDAATDFEPWTPDRVAVAELEQRSSFGDPDGDPTTWSGPPFDTFLEPSEQYATAGCGELVGADAAAVWAEALAEPGTTWADGDDQRELVVAALLPGQEPCREP